MLTTDYTRATFSGGAVSALCLAGAPALAVLLLTVLPGLLPAARGPLQGYSTLAEAAALLICCTPAGAIWGLALGRYSHYLRARRLALAGALAFGLAAAAAPWVLSRAQALPVAALSDLAPHTRADLLLAALVVIVSWILGGALGAALKSWRAAIRLAIPAALLAGSPHTAGHSRRVAELALHRLGFQAVVPLLPESLNALLIEALSLLIAAFAGGAITGRVLAQHVAVSLPKAQLSIQ